MTPTKAWTIELRYAGSEVIAGELHIDALVYSDALGFDARITYDGAVASAHVREVSRGPEHGYVRLERRTAHLDEMVRRICDCDDDLLEQLDGYMREYHADVDADRERAHCAGCSVCLGVPSYAGF